MATKYRSPNGAEWRVVETHGNHVVLDLERLPDGTPSELTNHQRYGKCELAVCDGWREL